jgi:hypothetical protein
MTGLFWVCAGILAICVVAIIRIQTDEIEALRAELDRWEREARER